nr:ABC-F family ATP-binding cassette domain-containing protein [Maliibacterium massiliense]
MMVLQAQKIEKHFGTATVLAGADLTLQQGQCLGIVGGNGCGKSTFLRIAAGETEADAGRIVTPGQTRIGYLAQVVAPMGARPVWEELKSVFDPVFAMEAQMRDLEREMGAVDAQSPAFSRIAGRYAALSDRFSEAGGYAWKSRLQGTLYGLGFTKEQFAQCCNTLSGGQQARLALARLLLESPDILLLDEPTNHLDLSAVQWLEDFLRTYAGSVIIVSHDRYFLDALCDDICELSGGVFTTYHGNYTHYLSQRQVQRELAEKHFENQRREVARQQEIIARYRRFNREKSIKQARSREKMLQRVALLERPAQQDAFHFSFAAARPSGQDVLMAENLSKSFDGKTALFHDVDIHIRAGERIALIGPNGSGKSTLLQILRGRMRPDTGWVRLGAGVSIGYFDQQQAEMISSSTVLEEIHADHPSMSEGEVRGALAAFLFRGDDVFQDIATLSGGEKARLALLKIMMRRDNTLLFDEPTNHLDVDARAALEAALDAFDGTILAVSHDRYFINRFATKLWILQEDGTLLQSIGNYDDYLARQRAAAPPAQALPDGVTRTALKKEQRLSRAAQSARKAARLRVSDCEKKVQRLEEEIARLEGVLSAPEQLSGEALVETTARYSDLSAALERAMDAWEEAFGALEALEAQ